MDAAADEIIRFLMEEGIMTQSQLNVLAARLERKGYSARAHEVRAIPFDADDPTPPHLTVV